MNQQKITIVMPCYKNVEYTKRAIDSLLSTSKIIREIIIIENDPEGSTLKLIKECGYTCSIQWNKENAGVSRSWNDGIIMASTRYVAVVNNDIKMLTEGWDELVIKEFEKNKKAAIICALPISSEDEYVNQESSPREGLNGSFFVLDKDAVRQTQNFKTKQQYIDTEYTPAYWEDVDLLVQIRSIGFESYVLPSIKCVHYSNITASKILPSHKGMDNPYWRNLDYFNKKYKTNIWDYFKVDLSNVLNEISNERLI